MYSCILDYNQTINAMYVITINEFKKTQNKYTYDILLCNPSLLTFMTTSRFLSVPSLAPTTQFNNLYNWYTDVRKCGNVGTRATVDGGYGLGEKDQVRPH